MSNKFFEYELGKFLNFNNVLHFYRDEEFECIKIVTEELGKYQYYKLDYVFETSWSYEDKIEFCSLFLSNILDPSRNVFTWNDLCILKKMFHSQLQRNNKKVGHSEF